MDVAGPVVLREVGPDNESACVALEVTEAQLQFVAATPHYLSLCRRPDSPWRPLAAEVGGTTVGFVMWGVDPDDDSFWIGGLVVDRRHQRNGFGRAIVTQLIERGRQGGHRSIALSFEPGNTVGRSLYASLGFIETDEREGDEIVARLVP